MTTTEDVMPPVPDGRGKTCMPFLASHGIVPRVPPIRSSDFELALNDPFRYFLSRRLGIVPAHSHSAALNRGSYSHICFEVDPLTTDVGLTSAVLSRCEARLHELIAANKALGIVGDSAREILVRERLDCETALGWYSAARTVQISDKVGTFPHFLTQPHWRVLARELPVSHISTTCGKPEDTPRNGLLDMLLHQTVRNELWILDLKTCLEPTINRLSTCVLEFQTQHYLHILENLILLPTWREKFSLPADVKIGGMMHLAMQKPDIKFCDADRNYKDVPFTPSRGPNKGVTRMEREYFGEPVLSNYINRCQQWYTGTGDYLHLAPERVVSPTVNISFSPVGKVLDTDGRNEYTSRLRFLENMATREAYPENFLRCASCLRSHRKPSKYAPFSLCPPRLWPEIMDREGFIVAHREEETTNVEEVQQEEVSQE